MSILCAHHSGERSIVLVRETWLGSFQLAYPIARGGGPLLAPKEPPHWSVCSVKVVDSGYTSTNCGCRDVNNHTISSIMNFWYETKSYVLLFQICERKKHVLQKQILCTLNLLIFFYKNRLLKNCIIKRKKSIFSIRIKKQIGSITKTEKSIRLTSITLGTYRCLQIQYIFFRQYKSWQRKMLQKH